MKCTITTPEGVTFSYMLAGPVARFLGWIIDQAVILAAMGIVYKILGVLTVISADIAGAAGILSYFLISIGYPICFEWYFGGRTLGKMLLRLRVMDVQGLRLAFSQIFIRNLLRCVDMLPLTYLAGGLACLLSAKKQRLGDLAANTMVIREPKIAQPDLDQLLTTAYNSLRDYPHLVARLRQNTTPVEADLALAAIFRRDELDPAKRLELFARLAQHFKAMTAFPEEITASLSDEQFTRNIVDALFRGGKG